MQKVLNIISVLLKAITLALGGLTATDVAAVHMSNTALGTTVAVLGAAGLVVKTIQSSTAAPAA